MLNKRRSWIIDIALKEKNVLNKHKHRVIVKFQTKKNPISADTTKRFRSEEKSCSPRKWIRTQWIGDQLNDVVSHARCLHMKSSSRCNHFWRHLLFRRWSFGALVVCSSSKHTGTQCWLISERLVWPNKGMSMIIHPTNTSNMSS